MKGLIHALLLDGQGGAKSLDWQAVQNWNPADGELWLHFDYTVAEVRVWFETSSQLDEAIVETLLSGGSRPRFSPQENGVLIAWRGVNLNSQSDPDDMVALRLWRDDHRLISTRRRNLVAVNEVVSAFTRGKGPCSTAELLVELASSMTRKIGRVLDDFDEQMAQLEESVIESHQATLRSELSEFRRQVIVLRRYIAPQKDALLGFSLEKLAWLNQSERTYLREVVDRITRHLEDLEALRERAVVAQEELQNRISEELNSRLYVLSMITAIFLPLGFFTGLFGINVGGMPGVENTNAFWYLTFVLGILVILQIFYFRWKRWL